MLVISLGCRGLPSLACPMECQARLSSAHFPRLAQQSLLLGLLVWFGIHPLASSWLAQSAALIFRKVCRQPTLSPLPPHPNPRPPHYTPTHPPIPAPPLFPHRLALPTRSHPHPTSHPTPSPLTAYTGSGGWAPMPRESRISIFGSSALELRASLELSCERV